MTHISQPNHWDKPKQPALCGSMSDAWTPFDNMGNYVAAGMARRKQICDECWKIFLQQGRNIEWWKRKLKQKNEI